MPNVTALEVFQERLVQQGLKSTRQRQLIVETFFEAGRHVSVDDLLEEVRRQRRSTGYATVYRTLKLLVELGMAEERRFGGAETSTIYEPVFGREEHFHLICEDCQRIVEFGDATLDTRHRELAEEMGFELTIQRVELYGRCVRPTCPNRRAKDDGGG